MKLSTNNGYWKVYPKGWTWMTLSEKVAHSKSEIRKLENELIDLDYDLYISQETGDTEYEEEVKRNINFICNRLNFEQDLIDSIVNN